MNLTQEELDQIIAKHQLWLDGEEGGELANFEASDLSFASLRHINLKNSYLVGTNLKFTNLYCAQMQRSDLRGANLYCASLVGANLEYVDLEYANLGNANLADANLKYANLKFTILVAANLRNANLKGIRVNWNSHSLVSEILWQASGGNQNREMLAALIGKKSDWCWDDWLVFDHPEKEWALEELRKWVKEGDDAPSILK